MENLQLSLFGKTSPEPSAPTKARTSEQCLKKSPKSRIQTLQSLDLTKENGITQERFWETVTVSRGECLTRNFGEYPKEESVSTLSQILQTDAPEEYYLTAKVCQGILRRAEKREKVLPKLLKAALECQAQNKLLVTTIEGFEGVEILRSDLTADNCKCLSTWYCQSKRIFDENGVYPCLQAMDCSGANNTAVLHTETLNMVQAAVVYENHSQDTRYKQLDGVAPTVSATYGMGGNNQPFVVEPAFVVDFQPDNSETAAGLSKIEEKSPALSCTKRAAVCYTAGNGQADQTKHHNVAGALNCMHDQQSVMACYPINTQIVTRSNKLGEGTGMGIGEDGDPAYTLQAAHSHGVIYAIDRAAFNQGANAQYDFQIGDSGINSTIVAKGASAVCHNIPKGKYYVWIVRRLTPLECCRLQGYPDWWAADLDTAEPTDEDLKFWADVFETHRKATDPLKKPKTQNQIKKWLQDPQTDSAEYKMWGNSLAIPCAYTVLSGIAEELKQGEKGDIGMENAELEQREIFTVKATRCKRCGGILLSEFGLKNGMGHICKRKKEEGLNASRIDENQMTLFELDRKEKINEVR